MMKYIISIFLLQGLTNSSPVQGWMQTKSQKLVFVRSVTNNSQEKVIWMYTLRLYTLRWKIIHVRSVPNNFIEIINWICTSRKFIFRPKIVFVRSVLNNSQEKGIWIDTWRLFIKSAIVALNQYLQTSSTDPLMNETSRPSTQRRTATERPNNKNGWHLLWSSPWGHWRRG